MTNKDLRAYAKLIAVKGANVQNNQRVIIHAELDQPEFIELLVEECYKCGASKVNVRWSHQNIEKLTIKYGATDVLSTVEEWELEQMKSYEKNLPAMIYILSEDPDGLNGIDQDKYSKIQQERKKAFKPIRDRMDNKYQWCIAGVAGKKWAKKLFPEETVEKATEKLWNRILSAARAYNDPLENWNEHNINISEKCKLLNSLELEFLEYKSDNGTDFKVGLIEGTKFLGGSSKTVSGVEYNANIPSEEIFISPKKGVADGTVVSTKPLCYQSQLIENFRLEFKNGKVVSYTAEKNEQLLGKLLNMDQNACYLGECALVPYSSPINASNILFYNTLYDENASCHLAFGAGFNECIEGYEKMSFEECIDKGINDSIIHEDFMIGTSDLSIIGIGKDGKRTQIFKDGEWSI